MIMMLWSCSKQKNAYLLHLYAKIFRDNISGLHSKIIRGGWEMVEGMNEIKLDMG